jgi:NADP-dependent 3-hydroxy acid dehydrogenase YdfG
VSTHVLTGAGSGIGRALATRLRDRGDRLVLLLRSADRIDQLRADFPSAVFVEADLARPATLIGIGAAIGSAVGDAVDSVLHVAGTVELGALAGVDLADWERQLAVNLTSPALITRELLPAVRRGHGTVVFVNSTQGLRASAGWSAYAASKFGLRALAEALREEEAAHGVRVTTVYPGRTGTPMQEKVHAHEGRAYDAAAWVTPETVADAICHVLDLPVGATIPDLSVRPA